MKIKFGLSNRQAKELLDRGRPLRIAVPAPDEADYDPHAYARQVLADVEPGWIVSAAEQTLPVKARIKDGGEGLGALLGQIAHEDHRHESLEVLVVCVVIELQAQRVARQPVGLTQWAGRIIE